MPSGVSPPRLGSVGHADARDGAARLVAAVLVGGIIGRRRYGKAEAQRGGTEQGREFTHRCHLHE